MRWTTKGWRIANEKHETIAIIGLHGTKEDAELIASAPTMYEFILSESESGNKKAKLMLDALGLSD